MKEIQEVYKKSGNLHHAYLIEGDSDVTVEKICKFIEVDLNFKIQGNPDFWNEKYESFGIDDARKIKEMQTRKSFSDKKIFILSCNLMTTEAQNSLLKLFEEPTEGTHFFIIVSSSEIFLPTLKSRMLVIKNVDQYKKEDSDFEFVEKFLKENKSKRLKMIKDIVDEKSKEKTISFLNNLEIILRKKTDFSSEGQTEALREIIKCRDYLNDRSPSVKLLLEHIALITPQVE